MQMRIVALLVAAALVHVPARAAASVVEGEQSVARPVAAGDVPEVKVIEPRPGEVILEVGSGEYRFIGR